MSLLHFGDPFRQLDRLTSQLVSGTRTPIAAPIDVWRSGDGYHVDLDLPGIDPSTVEVTSEKNMITIRAERSPEFGQGDQVLVAERPQGSFTRQLQLGDVNTGNIEASYHNGVLCLTIPVAQQAQPRRIEVRSSGGQQDVPVSSGGSGSGGSGTQDTGEGGSGS